MLFPWWRRRRQPCLTVVIPALNEEPRVGAAVASALAAPRGAVQVVVADGGSTDGTRAAAGAAGAQVVRSARGRGVQMNRGARGARGRALLFLHADSALPDGYLPRVLSALDGSSAGWGCFGTIHLDAGGWQGEVLRCGVGLRTRLLHQPYGDQGLFVRADLFREVGGYRELPLLEDVDLVARLKRGAGPPAVVPGAVTTSARRWQRLGFARTTLVNQAVMLGYRLGVDVGTLACWYGAWK